MTERIALTHRIEQQFDRRVQLSTHWLRVRPAPHARGVEAYSLKLDTEPHFLNWLRDPYENHLARLDLPEPVFGLGLDIEIIASLEPSNPFDFLVEPLAAEYPFTYPDQLKKELAPYLRIDRPGPWLSDWLSGLNRDRRYIIEKLGEICGWICKRIPSTLPNEPGWVDVDELLRRGWGSPWETAWLLTLSLRSLGLAARFTSGYRIWLSPATEMPDSAGFHAWSEVFLPGAGWIGLDPSAGLYTTEGYIPIASAPEPLRALPLSGYHEACGIGHSESLSLRRLVPAEPAWPFGDGTASDLRAIGTRVDVDLAKRDIDLTVGNALSFVSTHNPNVPEWTVAAVGGDKRRVAEALLEALSARIGPGAAFQTGQSEWFGGEELPRWRLSAYLRTDGKPVWSEPALRAGRRHGAITAHADDARLFAETLARKLDVPVERVLPAYEDGLHEIWAGQGGLDWTPTAEDLRDSERRRDIAACLSAQHGDPAGYVLPLRRDPVKQRWQSGIWTFRRGSLFLIPGLSPLGFRLPIDSLPVGEAGVADPEHERCQTEERPLLPEINGEASARYTTLTRDPHGREEADPPAADVRPPRTALAVELRDRQLHVFLPPLTHLEHFLELVAAIEAAARETGTPVALEGYEPPEDYRLRRLVIEPEPGTLKVWLPDATSFDSQASLIAMAHAEAERIGLSAERLFTDGTRLPAGGVAEIVLGGSRPSGSPFLDRPELLRALIGYWQRHPSLSYLFSGRLLGPDGPAPRPDEGRDDALYELGIALDRIPRGTGVSPWVPDRLLRHLLADPNGNMRRAEIRMDLLYAPDRPSLRLGKTVIRSFESAPNARLATLQTLLVKAILASLVDRADEPCVLIPWGAELHDRFMLPSVLWDDFRVVLAELARAGYPLQAEWFAPVLDLRFPVLGRTQIGDIGLELRRAHEPWPLLAEETTSAGVGRFIDSANERVELHISGLTPARYQASCNGFRVPLTETGVKGDYIAGIRFKVWNPVSTLHPTTLPVHSLVLDLIDTWTGRVVGGCTFFPPRPGLWGMLAGAPAAAPTILPGHRPELPRSPTIHIPPWSSGGRFIPRGGEPVVLSGLAELPNDGHPLLLDLTRTP
ncbi:MAG: transglutaminase family protein [Methylotetracoccus sp.]